MNPIPPAADGQLEGADREPKTFDLSVTQILGGALAAMTAAYLGSRLSVAGTVAGAAIASIVAGVAGTVYTASIRHTSDKVRSVWTGRVNSTPTAVVVTREDTLPAWEQGVTAASTAPAESVGTGGADGSGAAARTPMWRTGRFWSRIAIGAVATFAVAFAAVTGLELVSGQAFSGGSGTTVSQVREPGPAEPAATPSESPSGSPSESPSGSPSESPSASPTDEPSETPSAAPSEEPSTTPGATEAPSASPTLEPTPNASEPTPGDGAAAPGDPAAQTPATG